VSPAASSFGIADGRVVTRVGDRVLAVGDVVPDAIFEQPALNAFMAQGPNAWRETRAALDTFVVGLDASRLPSIEQVEMALPFAVADYVDFYASEHHATNLGKLFRPDGPPLLPNWRRIPVGYHGRAGSVAVSGTPVRRPSGLTERAGPLGYRPTAALDFELEIGFVVGVASTPGCPVPVDAAEDHIFGVVLLNDWSARDIQAFEAQPLGPLLGKSFLTSISSWVVTLDALRPFLVDPPPQEPEPDPHLRGRRPWALDVELAVELNGTTLTSANAAALYWTFAQQLAHLTSNGAHVRTGDLLGSGTVSGPEPGSCGSLIELTWNGRDPVRLDDGTERTFLEDGDTVVLRGWCGAGENRIDLGAVTGTVTSARR
jgi:fumarylacetoacetase